MRVETQDIIEAYKATGSVWKAAELLGISGQTVHARLKGLGLTSRQRWTPEEEGALEQMVRAHQSLSYIADHLGRSYAAVACKVNELGIDATPRPRPKKIPRGQGYDKKSMAAHLRIIDEQNIPVTKYARQNRTKVDTFVAAIQRHFPEWWEEYSKRVSYLDAEKTCPYCGATFWPTNVRQTYCSRNCQNQRRADDDYFGGKRRETYGLAENTCQMCLRRPNRGLSSHHVLGKENDPENTWLVALCSGCHQIITLLGGRTWNREQWEAIISLATLRRNGKEIARLGERAAIEVCVDLELRELTEEELEHYETN